MNAENVAHEPRRARHGHAVVLHAIVRFSGLPCGCDRLLIRTR